MRNIPGTFPTVYVQGYYFYLKLDVKTHKTSLTQTGLFQTRMQTYLRCAVLFASHLWAPVDPPLSCKDKKKTKKKKKLNNDIPKKCALHIIKELVTTKHKLGQNNLEHRPFFFTLFPLLTLVH